MSNPHGTYAIMFSIICATFEHPALQNVGAFLIPRMLRAGFCFTKKSHSRSGMRHCVAWSLTPTEKIFNIHTTHLLLFGFSIQRNKLWVSGNRISATSFLRPKFGKDIGQLATGINLMNQIHLVSFYSAVVTAEPS